MTLAMIAEGFWAENRSTRGSLLFLTTCDDDDYDGGDDDDLNITLMWQDLERVGGGGDLRERHSHSRFRSSWTTNRGYDDDDDNFVDNHADDDYEDDDSDIKARR